MLSNAFLKSVKKAGSYRIPNLVVTLNNKVQNTNLLLKNNLEGKQLLWKNSLYFDAC